MEAERSASASPARPVERLFPFVLKSRILIVGRDTVERSLGRLHFVLITEELTEKNRAEVVSKFTHYPVIQHYKSEDLEKFFGVRGAKVVGFAKSGLAQSIYAELKQYRINKPAVVPTPPRERPSKSAVGRKELVRKSNEEPGNLAEAPKEPGP